MKSRYGVLRRGRLAATAMALGVVAYVPAAMAALDLTGTWEGKWRCKDVASGTQSNLGGTLTMTVTQSGGDVNASVAWYGPDLLPYRSETFQGHVQELATKPGQGASTLVGCSTRPGSAYSEALSAKVKVSTSSATFKGSSAYEVPAPIAGGTCKYSLKRTDTVDPGVGACPGTPACGDGTIDAGEDCDVGNLNGHTCATQPGFVGGTLGCAAGCTFDTTECYATRYVVNGDGTVTDNLWKLHWEQKTDDGSVHDKDNRYTWCVGVISPPSCNNPAELADGTVITEFLATLNNGMSNDGGGGTGNCFAGHCDWRLPTIGDLTTIHACSLGSPCPDPTVFGPANGDFYWSGSTYPHGPANAWAIDTLRGEAAPPIKPSFRAVRAVRSLS